MTDLYAAMLVSLGFLMAALSLIVLLPMYRRRIERFTAEQLKRALPLTEAEIRADRDRQRAEFAVQVHDLQQQLSEERDAASRLSIEINRRDAKIQSLDEAVAARQQIIEEHENARRVLEQAIVDRLPKVEQRLAESRRMLAQRDAEIALLSETSSKQTAALEEATMINRQQEDELQRLRATIDTRLTRHRDSLSDATMDGEVALKSEIETLRAKTRDQASMIRRLQEKVTKGDSKAAADREREIARLKIEIGKLESELTSLKSINSDDADEASALAARLQSLERTGRVQAEEISRLRAALAAKSSEAKEENRLAEKAEIAALENDNNQQMVTIKSLRAELAASQEKLSRQAEQFSTELRRLSSQAISAATKELQSEASRRPSLVERLSAARGSGAVAKPPASDDSSEKPDDRSRPDTGSESGEVVRYGSDSHGGEAGLASTEASAIDKAALANKPANDDVRQSGSPRRPRLLDRINGLSKTN